MILPPFLLFFLLNELATTSSSLLLASASTSELVATAPSTLSEYIDEVLLSAVVTLGNYLLLTMPLVKVVLTDRDDILADGIRKACQRAGSGGRVVAVLGLLHVNGIADRILSDE